MILVKEKERGKKENCKPCRYDLKTLFHQHRRFKMIHQWFKTLNPKQTVCSLIYSMHIYEVCSYDFLIELVLLCVSPVQEQPAGWGYRRSPEAGATGSAAQHRLHYPRRGHYYCLHLRFRCGRISFFNCCNFVAIADALQIKSVKSCLLTCKRRNILKWCQRLNNVSIKRIQVC